MTDITTADKPHHVIVDKGWSYVIGPMVKGRDGPWRYQWEAQEMADQLNGLRCVCCNQLNPAAE